MAELYVPLSVNYDHDPKIIRAGANAELVFVRGMALAKRLLTDGHIDAVHLPGLCRGIPGRAAKHVDALVREGLWEVDGTGWRIVSWLKRNKSKAEIDARRAAKAAAGIKGNHVRHHVDQGKYEPTCELCIAGCDDDGSQPAKDRSRQSEVKTESESKGSEVGGTSHDNDLSVPRGGSSLDAIMTTGRRAAELLCERRMATGWKPDNEDAYVLGTSAQILNDRQRRAWVVEALRSTRGDTEAAAAAYIAAHCPSGVHRPSDYVTPVGDRSTGHELCIRCENQHQYETDRGYVPCTEPVLALAAVHALHANPKEALG